jgi:hypothetical protein
MKTLIGCALVMTLSLTGCGGGSDSGGDGRVAGPSFLFWSGNSSGETVIDANNEAFAFYSDTGCLYNFQTGRENTAFCLLPGTNVVTYGPFRGQVLNVRASTGACVAALIDENTANFADIAIDSFGREVVALTQLRPVLCGF